jgi:hypothetical protein
MQSPATKAIEIPHSSSENAHNTNRKNHETLLSEIKDMRDLSEISTYKNRKLVYEVSNKTQSIWNANEVAEIASKIDKYDFNRLTYTPTNWKEEPRNCPTQQIYEAEFLCRFPIAYHVLQKVNKYTSNPKVEGRCVISGGAAVMPYADNKELFKESDCDFFIIGANDVYAKAQEIYVAIIAEIRAKKNYYIRNFVHRLSKGVLTINVEILNDNNIATNNQFQIILKSFPSEREIMRTTDISAGAITYDGTTTLLNSLGAYSQIYHVCIITYIPAHNMIKTTPGRIVKYYNRGYAAKVCGETLVRTVMTLESNCIIFTTIRRANINAIMNYIDANISHVRAHQNTYVQNNFTEYSNTTIKKTIHDKNISKPVPLYALLSSFLYEDNTVELITSIACKEWSRSFKTDKSLPLEEIQLRDAVIEDWISIAQANEQINTLSQRVYDMRTNDVSLSTLTNELGIIDSDLEEFISYILLEDTKLEDLQIKISVELDLLRKLLQMCTKAKLKWITSFIPL